MVINRTPCLKPSNVKAQIKTNPRYWNNQTETSIINKIGTIDPTPCLKPSKVKADPVWNNHKRY